MFNIFEECKIEQQVMKAADNESLNGAGVKMDDCEGVAFVVTALKGEAAEFSIKAQQDSSSDYSTAADLAGTSKTFSTAVGTDAICVLDIFRPTELYVRPVVTVPNLAAATPVSVIAIKYGARKTPVTNTGELHVSPAEGTA